MQLLLGSHDEVQQETTLLLEEKFQEKFAVLKAETTRRHKVRHLEGDHSTFTGYFGSVMLVAYVCQLIVHLVMIARFVSLGAIGRNFWITSLSMVVWQYYANVVLFFAMFGVQSQWNERSTRLSRPLCEFIFFEGWCGAWKEGSSHRETSICLGFLLGPLCAVWSFVHWSRWEDAEEDTLWGRMKKCVGRCLQTQDLVDKRKEWAWTDLDWRECASAPQLFRYLTNPSVFLIIWNAPFAFFQLMIYLSAVFNLEAEHVNSIHVAAVFVSFLNVLLPVWFLTPTPFWEWFFLSFFSCWFDLVIIIITALVHPYYRDMNVYMQVVPWVWTWSTMLTSAWIPYWWFRRVMKRLVRSAHVGPRFESLQKFFTVLMGVFFTAVYTGLGQYRTCSWLIEFEFATNKMRFNPGGLFAKVIGWIRLPVIDPSAASANVTNVNDYDLRVLVANAVLLKHLVNDSAEERQITNWIILAQRQCFLDIVEGLELLQDSVIHRRRFVSKRIQRADALVKSKTNPRSLIERRIHEDWENKEMSGLDNIVIGIKKYVLSVFLRGYFLTRMVCWAFFLFTMSSFGYALVVENMGAHLNNRDVIVIVFLAMQCVNLVGIVYYGFRSYQVWKTSLLVVAHVEKAEIPVEEAADVLHEMVVLYDDVIQDAGISCLLVEFFSTDVGEVIRSYLAFTVDYTYLDGLNPIE